MDYGMIKIEKAKIYARERERIRFKSLVVELMGDNDKYTVQYDTGAWSCNCDFFYSRGVCSHTMAMERVLGTMVEMG
jgi:hypothetical protein